MRKREAAKNPAYLDEKWRLAILERYTAAIAVEIPLTIVPANPV